MARQLTFQIVAETYEAEAKLRVVEQQIADLNKELAKGAITWEEYEKQLKGASAAAAAQKQNVEELKKGTEDQTKKVGGLTTAIMRYASGAVLGAAVKGTIDWAGNLNDLSIRSGIGVVQLQKLSAVAARSGGSMENVANASAMLLDKLGSNDKNLIKAVRGLGLNLETLRSQDPGTTFIDLATAIAKVEDPAKRMAMAVDVFGRQGRTLMPTILEIGKGLEDIATASPESVESLDTLGDMFTDLWRTGKIVLAEVIAPFAPALTMMGEAAIWAAQKLGGLLQWLINVGAAGPLSKIKEWFDSAKTIKEWWQNAPLEGPKAAGAPGRAINEGLPDLTMDPTSAAYKTIVTDLSDKAKDLARAHKDAAKAAKELQKDHTQYARYLQAMTPIVPISWTKPGMLFDALSPALVTPGSFGSGTIADTGMGGWMGDLFGTGLLTKPKSIFAGFQVENPSPGYLPSTSLGGGLTTAPNIRPGGGLTTGAGFWGSAFGGAKGFGGGLASTVMSSITGGGNITSAIGGFLGGGAMSGVVGKFSESFSKSMLGGALSSILPGIGSLLGPAISWIGDKLFGGEAKKTKAARGDFITQFGGMEELRKQADLAGFSLDKLLTTKKTKTLEREIKALNKALEEMKKRVADIVTGLDELSRSGGLISQGLISKIQRDINNPEVQQAVATFMQQQTQTAVEALNTYLSEAQILTEGGATAMSGAIVATFQQLRDEGKTTGEALALLAPSITGLRDKLLVMGLDGGGAFEELARLAGIANSEVTGPWVQNAGVLNTILTALTNLGLTDPAIFAGIAGEITAIYDKLISLNVAPRDALILLQQPLQTLWQMQHDLGLQVDEATQKLIDQGLEAGVIGEQFKSAQDKMIEAVNLLIGRLDRLIVQLGGDIPTAIDQLPDSITIPINFDVQNPETFEGAFWWLWPSQTAPMARGGVVTRPTHALIGEAGPEAVIPLNETGGMLGGVTVNVDARGALLNDPASQQNLATIISDAVTRQLSLHTRYAVA